MEQVREKKNFTSVEEIITNGINRDNAIVRDWDRIYCNLAQDILDNGEDYVSRAGEAVGIFAPTFKLDVGKEFPILESKKVFFRNTISELLWIYQAQSNEISWLHDRNNHIWDEWEVDSNGDWHTVTYKEVDGKTVACDTVKHIGKEYAGTIGSAYGYVVRKYGLTDKCLKILKEDPNNRRNIISLWQDADLATGVLEPCVLWSHYVVRNGKLNLAVQQRSGDIPLGVPFNITQYAVLLSMFAKVSGYEVGELSWRIDDAHIYKNQLEQIKVQLERYKKMCEIEKFVKNNNAADIINAYSSLLRIYNFMDIDNKYFDELEEQLTMLELMITKDKPSLYVANKDNFYDFDNNQKNKDVYVKNYKSGPVIRFPVSK